MTLRHAARALAIVTLPALGSAPGAWATQTFVPWQLGVETIAAQGPPRRE